MEPQPQGMGEFARISGVFFEPKKTFADVAERPKWIVPMALVIVAGLIFCIAVGQRIGWSTVAQQQMEQRLAKATPEQREQAQKGLEISQKITPVIAYVVAIVGPPIGYLISAAVLMGIVSGLMSAPVKFKQAFAVMCYAGLPGIIFALLAVVVIYLKANPADFDIQHPLAFNAGAFMDPQTGSKFVYTLASAIDVFSIWKILLIAVGLKAAAGKKLSFGGALTAVVAPWAILVLIGASLAGVFS